MARVGIRGRPPSDRVEERVEPSWLVEGLRLGKRGTLEGTRARLDLPHNLDRLVRLSVVVDATQSQKVLTTGGRLERVGGKLVCLDLGNHPPALAYVN